MGRGVPWDVQWLEKAGRGAPAQPADAVAAAPAEPLQAPDVRSSSKDLEKIARNVAAGATIGGFCGALFGSADVLMDLKSMTAGQRNPATMRVAYHAAAMSVFMSTYYGVRKTLDLYNPYVPSGVDKAGFNDVSAAAVAFMPLAVYPRFRRHLPYGVALLVFDYFSNSK